MKKCAQLAFALLTATGMGGSAYAEAPVEHAAPTVHHDGAPADDDEVVELVSKQMRRYEPTIEACVADAKKRRPMANGQIIMTLSIVQRKVSLPRLVMPIEDAKSRSCILHAAQKWSLPAAQLLLPWSMKF